MQRETGFCVECRDVTSYTLQKKLVKKMIRGEELTFEITCAICDRCGEFMSVPGIIDLNVHEIDEQYRKLKGLVSRKSRGYIGNGTAGNCFINLHC